LSTDEAMKKGVAVFIFFFSAAAAFPQITDLNIYPEPAPPSLPPAGSTFTDPTFGTQLLRVTDSNDGSDNHHAYAYWPAMNMNSTRLYVMQTGLGPTLYDFDALNFSISNKRPAFAGNCPSGYAPSAEDAIWSDVNPDVIFVHDHNLHLYAYNVVSQTYTLAKDLLSSYPGAHSWQMNKDHANDDLFSFTWKDNAYANVGFITWRSSTNTIVSGTQTDIDECQPDRSGNFLVIKLAASGQYVVEVRILDLQTNTFTDITDGGPGNPSAPGLYWAPGHGDMGNGTLEGHDNWNNRLLGRTAANPSAFYSIMDFNNDWSQDYHGSHLADQVNWITLSSYVCNTLPNSGLFRNEIYLVSTDGLQNVFRLAHHHSDYLADYNANGASAYWSAPKACISKDGKWIVFTSNWGSTSRKDVFVLKVPALPLAVSSPGWDNPGWAVTRGSTEGSFHFTGCAPGTRITVFNALGERVEENNLPADGLLQLQGRGLFIYTLLFPGGRAGSGKLAVE
jgi:hypothetical protein